MDISAVPRINSIVLTGLDFSMKPERARYEVEKGFIKPFPEVKVMHQIKSLAIMVYNQEKMTYLYHSNVCDGRNALAYFICAVHRQQSPQPQTHTRQGSVSSQNSNTSRISCNSTGGKKNCELPKLVTTSMLPLGYWDGLFYALVAEIRSLHQDLQQRFGFGCENGTTPLHHGGQDGTSSKPVTPIDLASMLETAWYMLMDHRLVATLDDTVRMRRMRESTARVQADDRMEIDERIVPERPPIVYGLMDVNDLTPEIINTLLWEKHKPEIDRACTENFEDESMMTAYRAELHQKQIEEGMASATPLPSANLCACHLTCVCKMKCDQTAEGCTCQNRVHVYHIVHEQETVASEAKCKYVKRDESISNQFIGAASGNLAQLPTASVGYPDVQMLKSRCSGETAARNIDAGYRVARTRTNTNDSDLKYVPGPKTPHRGAKDPFPLGLYGNSPHRYPITRRPTFPTSNPEPLSFDTLSSTYQRTVTRKPVPAPIALPLPAQPNFQGSCHGDDQSMTPPTSSPVAYGPFSHATEVSYPSVPKPYSQDVACSPGSREGCPTLISKYNQDDYSTSPTPFRPFHPATDPAEDYLGLLQEHPSAKSYPDEPFPTLAHTTSCTPSRPVTSPSSASFLPILNTFRKHSLPSGRNSKDKPHPPLPDPDFITPRPALKQRYVSAGGTAKLHDRPEIPGPAFTTPQSPTGHAAAMTKEQVEKKMHDPDWVRTNFGDAAVASMGVDGTPRSSAENADVAMGGTGAAVDKRDRTSSGASKREKWKRVFSRKSSGVAEEDE